MLCLLHPDSPERCFLAGEQLTRIALERAYGEALARLAEYEARESGHDAVVASDADGAGAGG